jgi:rare lipoprotein A
MFRVFAVSAVVVLLMAGTSARAARSGAASFPSFPWEPELPHAEMPPPDEFGLASWYGDYHHGLETATGERFDQWALTAAHRTLPFGSHVEVTNVANGRHVRVRVNDRGPHVDGRVVDLSRAAAARIGAVGAGIVRVRVRSLD